MIEYREIYCSEMDKANKVTTLSVFPYDDGVRKVSVALRYEDETEVEELGYLDFSIKEAAALGKLLLKASKEAGEVAHND